MTDASLLSRVYLEQWLDIRRLTYDYLDVLQPGDLVLTLPLPESQSLGYQFWCMVGAHESYLKELQHGSWQGFSSSIDDIDNLTPAIIKEHMRHSDSAMTELLQDRDLEEILSNGEHSYQVVQRIIEHEMYHQGQLINFIYCHQLPIPHSWYDKWNLER